MAKINTTTWQYTYKDKSWKEVTKTIKNWSNVSDSQVSQLTNAVNQRQASGRNDVTITNDTSNAWYWNQRWTGNLMYNGNYAIDDMYVDPKVSGVTVTRYSDGTMKYTDQASWNQISENTYKSMLSNTNALWLNSSVKGLSNTYNTYWDLWGASSKPKYQWFGTMTGYNPALTTANLGTWYQFGTMAEQAEKNSPWYLEWRNNELASALLNSGITDQAWIRNFLSQYEWFNSYDPTGQNNTVQAIYNRIGQMQSGLGNKEEDMLGDQIMQGQYRDTVNSILNSAFGIGDMDSIKDMYGSDVYYSMMNALKDVEWTWNATDPASRSQLQWYLQEIIGSAVWTWVDQSKLNLAMNAILSNFTDAAQKQIQQDVLAVQNLQTKWMSADQIAKQTWMSKDQVNQLVLLSQWMPSQIWKYYEMNNDAEDLITEDYERNRENLAQQYKFNLEVANQEITQLREDFNKTYLDQQEANENTLHNMDLIAWMTGTWYSRRWLEGMSYAQQQANAVLNNLIDNYDRNNLDIANSIKSMTMAYQQNDAELVDQMNDAILNAKNNYIAQVSNIQSKYWLVWLEWQQAIAQAVQWFVNQAETIYNNAFNRAWTNTNNLISAVSSIWAIEQQQMQTKQMKIAEFQQDSMYMTQNQLKDYAQKNGLQMEYQQLVWYQQEATINTLAQYWLPSYKYSDTVNKLLSQWYTPLQAVNQILNSDEAKADMQSMQQAWNWKQWSDWTIYNTFDWTIMWWVSGGYSNWWYYDTQAIQQAVSQVTQQWIWQYTEWQQINKQCWAFVNDYLESMWLGRVFTDPIEKKKAAINTQDWYSPQVWDVVVMESPYEKSKQYGHVAIVTGINNDGTMNLARANTNWDKAYHTWKKAINSKDILGYYSPAIAAAWQNGGQQQQNNWYDPSLEYVFENMLANDWKIDSTTQNNLLKYWYSMQSLWQQYNAYKQSKWVTENTYKLPQWFTVTDPSLFNQMTAAEQKSIKSTLTSYNSMMSTAEKLKKLVLKYWAEVRPTDAKNEMQQYVRDIQLQAKELYNLWVLNWPDLSLMEDIIYNPASLKAKWQSVLNLRSKEDVWRIVENWINTVNNQALEKLQNYWISVAWNQTSTTTSSQWGRWL